MSTPEPYETLPSGSPTPAPSGGLPAAAAAWLIVCGQFVGLILILVGGYYLLLLLIRVIGFINAPETMAASLDTAMVVIGGEKLVVPNGGGGVSLGRLAAMGVLVVWHVIWLFVSGQVVRIGTTLLTTGRDERKLLETTVRATVEAAVDRPRKSRG